MMDKRKLSAALTLLLSLACAAVGWTQASFLWAPPAFDLTLHPGETTEIEMSLVNQGTEPASFSFYIADVKAKPKGYDFTEPDSANPYSCADWLTLEPTQATLEAQKGCTVKCTIKVPRDAKGARYGAVLCRLDIAQPEEKIAGRVEVEWHMATVLSLTVAGTRLPKTAEVTILEAIKPKPSQGVLAIKARLKNTSEVHIFGQGQLTLRDGQGRRIREYPLGRGRGMILPGAEMEFASIFRRQFLPGDYIADVAIDYGGNRGPARASLPFTVTRESLTSEEMIHQVAFYVTPQFRVIEASPGSVRGISLQLTNREDAPIDVQAALRDIQFDEFGRLIILDTQDGQNSAAPWITLQPAELELKAREQRNLRYKISVPRDFAGGGGYACLLFTASTTGADGEAKQSQAGTALLVSIPKNARREAQIAKVEVSQDPALQMSLIAVTLENQGNVYLVPLEGEVILHRRIEEPTPETNSEVEILPTERERFEQVAELTLQNVSTVLLPEASRTYLAVTHGKLPSGEYRVDVKINYGGEGPALFSQRFTVEADSEAAPQAPTIAPESEEVQ